MARFTGSDSGAVWTWRRWVLAAVVFGLVLLVAGFFFGPWTQPLRGAVVAASGEVYGSAFWDGFGSTLLAGVVSALVAVLTVRLTERTARRRALEQESRAAAQAMARATAQLWSTVGPGVAGSAARAAQDAFMTEVIVARPVLTDPELVKQQSELAMALELWLSTAETESQAAGPTPVLGKDGSPVEAPPVGTADGLHADLREVLTLFVGDLRTHRQGGRVSRAGRPDLVMPLDIDGPVS